MSCDPCTLLLALGIIGGFLLGFVLFGCLALAQREDDYRLEPLQPLDPRDLTDVH